MKLSTKSQALYDLIAPAVAACNVDLWGIEFTPQGKRSLLRIYIDRANTLLDQNVSSLDSAPSDQINDSMGRGVGVEDCVRVTQQVGALLDVHDPISGEYALEVSSPGWDRTFFKLEQMQDYLGQQVALRLIHSVSNRRKLQGRLMAVNLAEQSLSIEVDQQNMQIEADNIDKANLIYQE